MNSLRLKINSLELTMRENKRKMRVLMDDIFKNSPPRKFLFLGGVILFLSGYLFSRKKIVLKIKNFVFPLVTRVWQLPKKL